MRERTMNRVAPLPDMTPDAPHMNIPSYDHFIEPLLRHLAAHPQGVPARDAIEAAADTLGLNDSQRRALLPSGQQAVYRNRAGWAHDRLKRAGPSSSPQRGFWQITPAGLALAQAQAQLSPAEIERIARVDLDRRLREAVDGDDASAAVHEAATAALASPEDRLSEALEEMRASVAAELLEALARVTPTDFERIVLDLLLRMGYGASAEDLQRVGGSGDGGIDGIISLDKLGLEKVYVQAKRWQASVGRPEIQAFYGALAGQRARKGVFITTSTFTAQALEFARSVESIVLVDGQRLAQLMIDHELGVSTRALKLPRFDSDYFDADAR
ncbi:MAG: adenine/cytosine-specific restriction endonuclease Mrr [Tibeticola sp.]